VSGQRAPYEIRYAPAAADAITGLPAAARHALLDVLRQLADDPMAGTPYDYRWPPEFRTTPFGDRGLLAYVILHRRRQVVIELVTWAG
jgi:plasmid stabilization system protein ParE